MSLDQNRPDWTVSLARELWHHANNNPDSFTQIEFRAILLKHIGPAQAVEKSLRGMVEMMDSNAKHGAGSPWHIQATEALDKWDSWRGE